MQYASIFSSLGPSFLKGKEGGVLIWVASPYMASPLHPKTVSRGSGTIASRAAREGGNCQNWAPSPCAFRSTCALA